MVESAEARRQCPEGGHDFYHTKEFVGCTFNRWRRLSHAERFEFEGHEKVEGLSSKRPGGMRVNDRDVNLWAVPAVRAHWAAYFASRPLNCAVPDVGEGS